MKTCPKCGRSYSEYDLSFCLDDGEVLKETRETSSGSSERPRVNIDVRGSKETQTVEYSSSPVPGGNNPGGRFWMIAAVFTVLIVVILIVTGVAVFIYLASGTNTVASNQNSEVENLKKKVEELSQQLENRSEPVGKASPEKSVPPKVNPTPKDDVPEYDDEYIQRVNSPNDGFLALRDRPSARYGNRIAKIPDGDVVVIEGCVDRSETIDGRTGSWCKARWEGKEGWVFDVWLVD